MAADARQGDTTLPPAQRRIVDLLSGSAEPWWSRRELDRTVRKARGDHYYDDQGPDRGVGAALARLLERGLVTCRFPRPHGEEWALRERARPDAVAPDEGGPDA